MIILKIKTLITLVAGREEQLKRPKRGVFFHKVKARFFGHATENVGSYFPDQGPNPHPLH